MGLDAVEIVMDLEDRLGVSTRDEDLAHCRTVADLAAVFIAALPRPGVCPTAACFYELRRALVRDAGFARADIHPAANLHQLFPRRAARRRQWRQLRKTFPALPGLILSTRADTALLAMAAALFIVAVPTGGLLIATAGMPAGIALAILLAAAVLACFLYVQRLLATHFPPGHHALGDVVRSAAPGAIRIEGEHLLRSLHVVQTVRETIARQTGIPLEQIQPQSELLRDLKLD
jgi:acyl carrier protein